MIKTELQSIQPDPTKLFGIYRGVVEDNSSDPEKSGRIKIRVFGVHTAIKVKTDIEGIPTKELPWAEPALGIFEGAISGNGAWTMPLQGSHVFVFFENGHHQQPRYFASAPGISKTHLDETENLGFCDPEGEYPNLFNQPDLNKLAREVTEDTIVEIKNDNRRRNIPTSAGGHWDESESPYNAEYPHNTVIASHGGLVVEMDSTENEERFHLYHPSKSYWELDKNGNLNQRFTGSQHEIIDKDKRLYVRYNSTETIGGGKYKLIKGNEIVKTHGSQDEQISGKVYKSVGLDEEVEITGSNNISVNGRMNIGVGGGISMDAPFININCQGYPPGGSIGGSNSTPNTDNLFSVTVNPNNPDLVIRDFNPNYDYQSNPIVIHTPEHSDQGQDYLVYNGGSSWLSINQDAYSIVSKL